MIKLVTTRTGHDLGFTIVDFDYPTKERIAVGRICRCGECLCCKTKEQADLVSPSLENHIIKQFIGQ